MSFPLGKLDVGKRKKHIGTDIYRITIIPNVLLIIFICKIIFFVILAFGGINLHILLKIRYVAFVEQLLLYNNKTMSRVFLLYFEN